jgi:hypothetical protein
VLVGVIQEGDDLLLLARIERTGVDFAASGLDLLDQRRQLVAVAAAGEDGKALGGKLLGDLATATVAFRFCKSLLPIRLGSLCARLFLSTLECRAQRGLW